MSLYKPKKSPFWHYDFQVKGRRFHGSTGQTRKTAARKVEATERLRTADGPGRPEMTVDEVFGLYWCEVGERKSSAKTIEYQLKNLKTELGKDTLLSEIHQTHLARHAAKRAAKVSLTSVNRELETCRAAFRYAAKQWDMARNEIDWTALRNREPQERIRELSATEQDRLFAALRPDLHDFVLFAILSGARRASIIGLKWSDIDFQARTARIRMKGSRVHSLPLTPAMTALLANQPRAHDQVFTYVCGKSNKTRRKGRRYPLTQQGWKRSWSDAVTSAGIEDFRFHDLRHTSATRLMRATGNLKLVQRLLGHAAIATTARYSHVNDDDLRAGMAKTEAESRNSPELPISSSVRTNSISLKRNGE